MKGLVRGQAIVNNNKQALGRKGDFAVHASVYGKVQAGLTSTSDGQGGLPVLPELGCLATYIPSTGDTSCKSWQKIFIINNTKSS